MTKLLDGVQTTAEAIRLCRPGVIVTHQYFRFPAIFEYLAEITDNQENPVKIISAEDECAAASMAIGAVYGGARVLNVVSSDKLVAVNEQLQNMAALRLPIVQICFNYSQTELVNDYRELFRFNSAGWIQLFVSNAQELLDSLLQACKLSEQREVPVMICADAGMLEHAFTSIDIPDSDSVSRFLPGIDFARALNPQQPIVTGQIESATPENIDDDDIFAFTRVVDSIVAADSEFHSVFKRYAGGAIQGYQTSDATLCVVCLGGIVNPLQRFVDKLRKQGIRIGVLRLRLLSPFPQQEFLQHIEHIQRLVIIDPAYSFERGGVLTQMVKTILFDAMVQLPVYSIAGNAADSNIILSEIEKIIELHDTDRKRLSPQIATGE